MAQEQPKRYLLTFTEPQVSAKQASAVTGLPTEQFQEGIARVAAGTPGTDELLHFPDLGISVVTLAPEDAKALGRHESILAVEEETEMRILGFLDDPGPEAETRATAAGTPRWNMVLVKAPEAWARGYDGNGIGVAVLDTGIAAHPDLVIAGGISCVPGVSSYNDGNGHGTHCAGIIGGLGVNDVYGVAPKSSLYAVKVLSDSGSGSSSWVLAGMQWCIDNSIRVASMSLGSQSSPSVAFARAIQACQTRGVVVICAAGNSYQEPFPWVNSPANSDQAGMQNERPMAVAAIDQSSVVASFSSRGGQTTPWNQVTVSAPGVKIYSTYLNQGYTTMSGTSMACPHTAGLAALVCERNPGISPQLVNAKISTTAPHLGQGPYPNTAYGYGRIDCGLATR
jgi:subtilisin